MTILLAKAAPVHGVHYCPDWIVKLFELLQGVADIAGMTAVAIGLVGAVAIWVRGELKAMLGRRELRWISIRRARLFLGNYILLGLELMIVSDLVHSFLNPDLENLYMLGMVVLIRTAISYFLGKELEGVRHEETERASTA